MEELIHNPDGTLKTKPNNPYYVGRRVEKRLYPGQFLIPVGTRGVIDRIESNGMWVAWDGVYVRRYYYRFSSHIGALKLL